jgi:zinc protease
LAGTLGSLRHLDRTMRWEEDFEKRIAALTPEQISGALKRHLDPKKLVIVNAGDFEAVAKDGAAKPGRSGESGE